jgi:zinc transporter 1/2/3
MTIFFIENVLFSHTHEVSEEFHHHNPSHNASHNESLSINYIIHEEDVKTSKKSQNRNELIPAIILTSALVVHSIFEGIAVGLLKSKSGTITLCVAVLIHNIPAAIALGIKLQSLARWIYCTLMAVFVFCSPFSIMIGIFLSGAGSPGVEGTFLSISAGTFIYIGCSEILPEEMEKDFSKFAKFGAFSLGLLPLAIFFLLAPED